MPVFAKRSAFKRRTSAKPSNWLLSELIQRSAAFPHNLL
jgi:hypothetical protein